MSETVKRQYNSTRRQEQAAETRLRIIQAAHELFVAKGYGRTTIAEIAEGAGVAVETVYAAFRNKRTLLRQVWFVSTRGDEVLDRSLAAIGGKGLFLKELELAMLRGNAGPRRPGSALINGSVGDRIRRHSSSPQRVE